MMKSDINKKLMSEDQKHAVIDVGSNSVRILIVSNGFPVFKDAVVTRLSENLSISGILQENAMIRTSFEIKKFVELAKDSSCKTIRIFATEAVRSAKNKTEFLTIAEKETGIKIHVVDGETEALLGIKGATNENGGIVDIGGGSTEIAIQKDGKVIYSKSVSIGSVRLLDLCSQNIDKIDELIAERLRIFGKIPETELFYAIGGTATTLASIDLKLVDYDCNAVHNHILTLKKLEIISDDLMNKSIEERKKIVGLAENRAEVIGGASRLLLKILKMLKIEKIIVSEKDNLDGYIKMFRGANEKIFSDNF